MLKTSKIFLAGHHGMVGSAIHRNLVKQGYTNIITRSKSELNLLDQAAVEAFFASEKPEYVIDAAAKVGGIMANSIYRAQFLYENITIQDNIIHNAWKYCVKKLLFLGSSCIYPREAPQPLKEEYLLTGPLEPTNEPYAIAKITGIKMCEAYYRQYGSNFISVMPTNLYGPNDNYNLETSHVLPALIRKLHLAKCVENNDWQAIRTDLAKRPVTGIKPEDNEQKILEGLEKFGIFSPTPSGDGNSFSPAPSGEGAGRRGLQL
ncbi:MAG: NAD-dependent epimerase/dehydratase family protein, partial [Bacteroidota bacterium]|nr:NAD-dependent epimerase/dehydratase family protein [Bacteroidota bacterium]